MLSIMNTQVNGPLRLAKETVNEDRLDWIGGREMQLVISGASYIGTKYS